MTKYIYKIDTDKFILDTNSGSCVYGIFKNKQDAKLAYNNLKDKYKTYICTSYNYNRNITIV